jgi:zinc/manganese transport system substrate-binding protein
MVRDMPMPRRRTVHALRLAAAAAATALLAACGSSDGDGGNGGNDASDDAITVVASTNVYGDLVASIAGSAADVTSVITDPDQDPHSYEADAKTQLALRNADLVIENGGGYDDFMSTMLDAAGGDATVITAVDLAGDKAEDNEHVWYDLPTMSELVERLVEELTSLDEGSADTFASNGEQLQERIAELQATADQIAASADGAGAAITEPVPLFLLEACGLTNLTPEGFSEAVEEGGDVSPRDLNDMLAVLQGGDVRILAYNEQTSGPETTRVIDAATSSGVTLIAVRETLPEGENYVEWMAGYLTQIQDALAA